MAEAGAECTDEEIDLAICCMLNHIAHALCNKRRVELRGVGVMGVHVRAARQCRDPRTGQPVYVGERPYVVFKLSRLVREAFTSLAQD